MVSCIVPLCILYLRCLHVGASTSDTLRSRWAGKGRCICRAHTQRGEHPCHKQVPLSSVVQLSTSLASMAVDEKAFAIHSMHKVAIGGEGDRRGSTRHLSLKSHWHSWGGRHEYMWKGSIGSARMCFPLGANAISNVRGGRLLGTSCASRISATCFPSVLPQFGTTLRLCQKRATCRSGARVGSQDPSRWDNKACTLISFSRNTTNQRASPCRRRQLLVASVRARAGTPTSRSRLMACLDLG